MLKSRKNQIRAAKVIGILSSLTLITTYFGWTKTLDIPEKPEIREASIELTKEKSNKYTKINLAKNESEKVYKWLYSHRSGWSDPIKMLAMDGTVIKISFLNKNKKESYEIEFWDDKTPGWSKTISLSKNSENYGSNSFEKNDIKPLLEIKEKYTKE